MNIFLVVYFRNHPMTALPDDITNMALMNRVIELRPKLPSRSTKIQKGMQAEITSGEQDGELAELLQLKLGKGLLPYGSALTTVTPLSAFHIVICRHRALFENAFPMNNIQMTY